MDPARFFEDNLILIEKVIKSICIRNYIHGEDAKDVSSHIKLKLIEDDYKKIKDYSYKSSVETYLAVVIVNILRDMKRKEVGRWRPSSVAEKIGSAAVIMERLTCRDKHTFEEAYEILKANHHVSIGKNEAYEIFCKLPEKSVRAFVRDEGDELLAPMPDPSPGVIEKLIDSEFNDKKRSLMGVIKEIKISLSSEDRLLLKMVFEDDQKISVVARILNKDRSYVDKRIKAVLTDFRKKVLAVPGINEDEVLETIRFVERTGEDNG